MRKMTFVSVLSTLLVLVFAGVASAQSEPIGDPDASCEAEINNTYGSIYPLAQTFVAKQTGLLTGVRFIGSNVGDNEWSAAIHTVDNQGVPTDTVLADTDRGGFVLEGGVRISTYHFDPHNAAIVTSGQTYALVLTSDRHVGWAGSTDLPCGDSKGYIRWNSTEGWQPLPSPDTDFVFLTYVHQDTVSPSGSIVIKGGRASTRSRLVPLRLEASDSEPGSGVALMRFSNDGTTWSAWEHFLSPRNPWQLTKGAGKKTVYVQYQDRAGNVSPIAKDTITYRP